MKASVYRKAHFNSAHQLYNSKWDHEKNVEVFGLCANPNFHGHNYELIVKVTGEIDSETGFVIDLGFLKGLMEQHVLEKLDHRNLNKDVPEFASLNPTVENIAVYIYDQLRPNIQSEMEIAVRLYETPRNFVDYPA